MQHLIASLLLWAGLGLSGPAAAQDLLSSHVVQTEQARVELLAHAPDGVTPGKPMWLGLRIAHAPHWHTYWQNPGDSGLPTELQWTLPQGVTAGPIGWPTPRKFPLGELANYGYDGTVLLPVPLTVTREFQGDRLVVGLQATWLICRQECLPQQGRFQLNLPATVSSADQTAAFETAWALAPQPQAAGASRLTVQGDRLQVSLANLPAGWRGRSLEVFPERPALVAPGGAWTQRWDGGRWTADLPLSADRTDSPAQVPLVVALADDAGAAGVRVEVPVPDGWPAPTAAPPAELPPALSTALANNAAQAPPTTAPHPTWWAALLGALLGGLVLNLMPCVFPVLAIKVVAFARHADNRRAHRLAGLAYTAGVLLSFVGLGALLLGLRAAGEQLGWGFQLQHPGVVAGLATLFTLIGLNLMGLFDVGRLVPAGLAGLHARHPVADAFLTGVLATAVASPCTAPFMGASLGLAVTLPADQALAVFGALGLGMALPYLAASWWPAVARALPRPGPWMDTLRQGLAFPMFATVVWLLWVLGQQTGVDGAAALLLLLVTLAGLLWALGRQGRTRWVWSVLMAILLVWGTTQLGPHVTRLAAAPTASADHSTNAWEPWTPERQQALLAEGRPVFVDFTAAWCVTCQYNKRTALAKETVLQAFAQRQVALLRADWTRRDPAVTEALRQLQRNGVPVYALHAPGRPVTVLSEVLSTDELLNAIGRL